MAALTGFTSWVGVLAGCAALAALSLTTLYSYLLFHTLAELFSIIIASGVFFMAWNSRPYHKNGYLLFIGIAYLFVALFDVLHTMAYKGMDVFPGFDDNNLPPQIWLVARYMEALALLFAPLFFRRRVFPAVTFGCFLTISLVALLAIFHWKVFPDCFLPGVGLTSFKIVSEYAIMAILVVATALLLRNKDRFEPDVLRLLILSILATIATEFCFTLYVHLYAPSNLLGHLFKIVSFWFMYQAIIVTGLTKPYDLLLRDLQLEIEERKKAEQVRENVERIIRHDIKSPLIGLQSMAKLAFEDKLNDEFRALLPGLMRGVRNVIGLLDSTEKIHQMEKGTYAPQAVRFDLLEVMHDVEASLAPLTKARQVRLVHSWDSGPAMAQEASLLSGEQFLVEIMLTNLVKNAVEASPKGGQVTVSWHIENNRLRIDIHNQGAIPEAVRDTFFEKFATADKSYGTGLGTYSARLIARAHGGDISFTTSQAEGTTVTVTLPCPKASD
ncbi:MAG: GHKL domain-containing protein [Desulfovibrio sp.]|nr:GHKL domain-containing protein [Desulfovibrio sp.]MBI4961296.1 GHKL domain-containing protein [Desulfovibrio sp.]